MTGPLTGLHVVEIAAEATAYPGKLLADLGADVIVVEPPSGAATRGWGPFANDEPGVDNSLHWWHYNTSKRSVTLELETPEGRREFDRLLVDCDLLLEGGTPELTIGLGLTPTTFGSRYQRLVWLSITPFGRRGGRPDSPATDLTLLAGGGPVFSCGYDDHSLPPVRGEGGQSWHVAGSFAVMSAVTALLSRNVTGRGQYIDLSIDAALNVSCEHATMQWLANRGTVQRQTGRHAMVERTTPTQVKGADGRFVTLGFPPRAGEDYAAILAWIDDLGLTHELPEAALLEIGAERGGVTVVELTTNPLAQEIWNAARAGMALLAERLSAYDFFLGCQRRGLVAGIVLSPQEAMVDPQIVARQFPTPVTDHRTGRTHVYPGGPIRFTHTPWQISRVAPRLGEHTEEILAQGWNHD